MDKRRHSVSVTVDVPISKTLVALRRVRSLRDPSTISMSKFPALFENWETNSSNGINLGFENGDLHKSSRKSNARMVSHETSRWVANIDHNEEECDEGVGSCNAPSERSMKIEKTKRKNRYRKHIPSSKEQVNEDSSRALALYMNEDIDVVDSGISCCWARTPRLRENEPLLDGLNGLPSENFLIEQLSMAQKFRPRSFEELVGQNGVVKALLGAISNENLASFYLFHGPRGTGKTSSAKIFSAAINCLSPEKPCGLCQECSGTNRNVLEIDCVKINKPEKIRSLTKGVNSSNSKFKVFILDECHLLREEAWETIQELSRWIIFILITPYLDRLPRNVVSMCQRFHFPKLKEADIAKKLSKICVEERLDFDQDALHFIGSKSSGSLRDAEMTLEQLSLLGKRITLSLVYELIGLVSEDELLDLLHVALSSDTSGTVKRARELMRSIDPMQLISQLANIIMDILAEKSPEAKRKLFGRLATEADIQQLNHALKILTETEKQLRTSKNQTTWLTVALLQLSSVGSSFNAHDVRTLPLQDNDFCSTSSTGESLKHLVPCTYYKSGSRKVDIREEGIEDIWSKATGICEPSKVKKFLRKRGKLLSVSVDQGIAVAELGFNHEKYVLKAEKSWKLIASALQSTLGHNIELRINLVSFPSKTKNKPSFNFFNCSKRNNNNNRSISECESDLTRRNGSTCSSDCGSQDPIKILRNSDGNALSIGCEDDDPYMFSTRSNDEHKVREYSKLRCWRNAMFPFRKAW